MYFVHINVNESHYTIFRLVDNEGFCSNFAHCSNRKCIRHFNLGIGIKSIENKDNEKVD